MQILFSTVMTVLHWHIMAELDTVDGDETGIPPTPITHYSFIGDWIFFAVNILGIVEVSVMKLAMKQADHALKDNSTSMKHPLACIRTVILWSKLVFSLLNYLLIFFSKTAVTFSLHI